MHIADTDHVKGEHSAREDAAIPILILLEPVDLPSCVAVADVRASLCSQRMRYLEIGTPFRISGPVNSCLISGQRGEKDERETVPRRDAEHRKSTPRCPTRSLLSFWFLSFHHDAVMLILRYDLTVPTTRIIHTHIYIYIIYILLPLCTHIKAFCKKRSGEYISVVVTIFTRQPTRLISRIQITNYLFTYLCACISSCKTQR